ncbi:glutathione S-transferase family protein, partial [Pseudomonas syringae]
NGESETPAVREKNPSGKIPVLELEEGTCLWEDNAILNCLADGSSYLPSDPRLRTQVLQWQFFEQYSHEPSVAVARFIQFYLGLPAERMTAYRAMQKAGYRALAGMERQRDRTPVLAGENFSLADIALYAFTHAAPQGGFGLGPHSGV